MANFDLAFPSILIHEGGYVNDPDDPGGETYQGIARKMHPLWLGWTIIDLLKKQGGFPVSVQSPAEMEILKQLDYKVKSFYFSNFWMKIQGDKIADQKVADSIFDFAINAGIPVSISLAQSVVNAKPDGVMGAKTIDALNRIDVKYFLAAFTLTKINRYVAICNKRQMSKKYFFGWVVRSLNHTV
ncbi:MAG: glycosyl hydrolase 108 family protein [Prolixibacteraceae bacterium]